MKKTMFIAGLCLLSSTAFAFNTKEFHQDNADEALRAYTVLSAEGSSHVRSQVPIADALKLKTARTYHADTQQYTSSYYQYYHGIQVLDGEVTIHESTPANAARRGLPLKRVSGQLLQDIEVSPVEIERYNAAEKKDRALADAKAQFLEKESTGDWKIDHDQVHCVLKEEGGKLKLLYEVVFYAKAERKKPILFHALLDPAQHNKAIKIWDDVMHFSDKGPGGNDKTKKYQYGVEGIPFLEVNKKSGRCVLEDKKTKITVVDMSTEIPENNGYYDFVKPYAYQCNSDQRDAVEFSGAFSPADDAYYFGQLVYQVYQDWYDTKILDLSKIILRVHYQELSTLSYDNAFWDPVSSTMNFGDGTDKSMEQYFVTDKEDWRVYPLVSLDVTAHEMSHGFTSAHSRLRYHDESGALNESFSDMAGMVAVAYLHEKNPSLYHAIYHSSAMNWSFAGTIMKNPDSRVALRYFDKPSKDGLSADCYQRVSGCAISYLDLVNVVMKEVEDPRDQQGIIVHHGSGVFNRFFYFLARSSGWDVKKAFHLMLVCNRDGYWTSNTTFNKAACGVLRAAQDLGYDNAAIVRAFARVGLDTSTCAVAVST